MTAMVGFFSVSNVTAMLEINHTPKNRTAAASAATKRRSITSGLAANSNSGANHRNIRTPIHGFPLNMKSLCARQRAGKAREYLDHEHVDEAHGLFVPALRNG